MIRLSKILYIGMLALLLGLAAQAQTTYRLYDGVTFYVNNPEGKDFTIQLDLRDLNLLASGPREVLFKVYDPDGYPVVREIIPDDGVDSPNFPNRIGGWDHELMYYANLYAKGTTPSFRWSAWSDPNRLSTIVARTFSRSIEGGKKGVYRILLAGTPDHYVTLKLSPDLAYGVAGHHTWIHGHGNLLKKSYIYVPKGSVGIFFGIAEPDIPRTRHFKLTAPDGKVLFDGMATGSYVASSDKNWKSAGLSFTEKGQYDGKLLTLDVSEGPGDYLLKITLQQPFGDYVGMGSLAVYAPDKKTAMALKGGTIVQDDMVFWHPFQVRFHNWLKTSGLDESSALYKQLKSLFNGFRLFEVSDGRGTRTWTNWAYAFGYYGCKIWRPAWLLMQRDDVPKEVKDIILEGLIMGGDRLSFAVTGERVNGNAFAQIPVALWYCQAATGDEMQKDRYNVYFERWRNEGWDAGCGISKSGDSQEHFAHDMAYGYYILDNWGRGGKGTWVKPGILDDTDDPRFEETYQRILDLYTYLHCEDENGRAVDANPWSSRTHQHAGKWGAQGWKGKPGPGFTVSVNDGDEWFAAHRKNYYILTFHGRLAPEWLCRSVEGQVGFGGGIICQLTVPGKGPVLASTLAGSYGKGMHPSNWRRFHIHSIVGERWDGRPLVSAISEHDNARLIGNTVTSSGEIRDAHVKVTRRYTYNEDSIDCEMKLEESDYARVLSIWSGSHKWAEIKLAYEMIPFVPGQKAQKTKQGKIKAKSSLTRVSIMVPDAAELTSEPTKAQTVVIDRGGYGVRIELEKPMNVSRGLNNTVLIQLTDKDVPAEEVGLKYRLVPFVSQ